MVTTKNIGTKGLKPTQAINWVKEVHTKYSLNDSEDVNIKEALNVIDIKLHQVEKLEQFKEYALSKLNKKDLAEYMEQNYF